MCNIYFNIHHNFDSMQIFIKFIPFLVLPFCFLFCLAVQAEVGRTLGTLGTQLETIRNIRNTTGNVGCPVSAIPLWLAFYCKFSNMSAQPCERIQISAMCTQASRRQTGWQIKRNISFKLKRLRIKESKCFYVQWHSDNKA